MKILLPLLFACAGATNAALAQTPPTGQPDLTQAEEAGMQADTAEARTKLAIIRYAPTARILGAQLAIAQDAATCGSSTAQQGARALAARIEAELAPMIIHPEIAEIVARASQDVRATRPPNSLRAKCETALAVAGTIALERMAHDRDLAPAAPAR